MSILEMLKQAQGSDGLRSLAGQFGLDPEMTGTLTDMLTPTIAGGMQERAEAEGGLGQILQALQGEDAAAFAQNPIEAAAPQARAQGEDFLAQIFGTRAALPEIAEKAAAQTGAASDQVAQFLPALAAMIQGVMQQNAPDAEIAAARAGLEKTGDAAGAGLGDLLGMMQSGGGIGGLVSSFLSEAQPQSSQGGLSNLLAMLEHDGSAAKTPGNPINDILGKLMR